MTEPLTEEQAKAIADAAEKGSKRGAENAFKNNACVFYSEDAKEAEEREEDHRFWRRIRKMCEAAAFKVGQLIIIALIVLALALIAKVDLKALFG